MSVDRAPYLGGGGGVGLNSIERNRGVEIGAHPHGKLVDDAAAEAKSDRPELTGPIRQGFQPHRRSEKILLHLGRVDLLEKRRAFLVVAGITADGSEPIGREGDEVGDGERRATSSI